MRIAILDDYQGVSKTLADWSRLEAEHEVTVFRTPFASSEETCRALSGFEIACIMRERTAFMADTLAALPKLKLLVTTGMRNDSVDLAAAKARGIVVSGTESPGHATAELAFALLMMLARGLATETASMRSGGWQVGLGTDIRGRTLGLVGLGRLGAEMAGFARAFGMRVIAWSQNLTDGRAAEHGATRVGKDDLFRSADFVSIHIKASERSRGLVSGADIAMMKPSAYLINTSRASILDMAALAEACRAGRIAGAALDVYETEPLPSDDTLRTTPRLLLTPHVGYVTRETYEVFYRQTVEAVESFIAGSPLRVLNG